MSRKGNCWDNAVAEAFFGSLKKERIKKRIYKSRDLASGQNILFAATGVTDGTLMKGVRFFGDGVRTTSLVMQTRPHRIRFVDSIHVSKTDGVTQKIRF